MEININYNTALIVGSPISFMIDHQWTKHWSDGHTGNMTLGLGAGQSQTLLLTQSGNELVSHVCLPPGGTAGGRERHRQVPSARRRHDRQGNTIVASCLGGLQR